MRYWLVAVGLFAALVLASGGGFAGEKQVTLTGTVAVEKDDDDNVTAVTLTVGKTAYKVTLNDAGKKLGEEMNGKKVEATGVLTEKNEEKWLTVTSYKEVKDEEEGGDE